MLTDQPMTPDQEYFEYRAEAELELAQAADHPGVVKAHYMLAGLYLDLVHRDGGAMAPDDEARAA